MIGLLRAWPERTNETRVTLRKAEIKNKNNNLIYHITWHATRFGGGNHIFHSLYKITCIHQCKIKIYIFHMFLQAGRVLLHKSDFKTFQTIYNGANPIYVY